VLIYDDRRRTGRWSSGRICRSRGLSVRCLP
jgi:hypothetical protein